jgi:hypothetical protein
VEACATTPGPTTYGKGRRLVAQRHKRLKAPRHLAQWYKRPVTRRLSTMCAAGRDRGMSTAEYAVGTIAACGFAALLFKIVTSDEVRELLVGLINRALNIAG